MNSLSVDGRSAWSKGCPNHWIMTYMKGNQQDNDKQVKRDIIIWISCIPLINKLQPPISIAKVNEINKGDHKNSWGQSTIHRVELLIWDLYTPPRGEYCVCVCAHIRRMNMWENEVIDKCDVSGNNHRAMIQHSHINTHKHHSSSSG